jgi:hypothetical protein
MSELINGAQLLKAEAACALIVCSQALLYTEIGDRYRNGGDEGLNRSRACELPLPRVLYIRGKIDSLTPN